LPNASISTLHLAATIEGQGFKDKAALVFLLQVVTTYLEFPPKLANDLLISFTSL
jgi:hypothetical protein